MQTHLSGYLPYSKPDCWEDHQFTELEYLCWVLVHFFSQTFIPERRQHLHHEAIQSVLFYKGLCG